MDALKTSCLGTTIFLFYPTADIYEGGKALFFWFQWFQWIFVEITSFNALIFNLAKVILDGLTTNQWFFNKFGFS